MSDLGLNINIIVIKNVMQNINNTDKSMVNIMLSQFHQIWPVTSSIISVTHTVIIYGHGI
jgi:predicted small secreted protein